MNAYLTDIDIAERRATLACGPDTVSWLAALLLFVRFK
jgi:hypothetical protein